ncbi:MAG: efflux transporter periplasmic adaptor subunit, partial [Planctomycetes bacterium]|nr:efflux transporter periplasmic adaptor subunit [Planctomycetota bacterium]
VRVQVPISPKYLAILVSQDAIGTDLNQKFVYVLNDKNEAVRQPVELGSLHEGLQVVSKGLKPEDRVIIEGLQHIKPGDVATPNLVKMPMPASETPPPAVRNLPQASPPPKS